MGRGTRPTAAAGATIFSCVTCMGSSRVGDLRTLRRRRSLQLRLEITVQGEHGFIRLLEKVLPREQERAIGARRGRRAKLSARIVECGEMLIIADRFGGDAETEIG